MSSINELSKFSKARTDMLNELAERESSLAQLHLWWLWRGISEKDQKQWATLINRLAKRYIKGFAPKKSNPTVWTQDRKLEFYCDYYWLKKKHPQKSDAKICEYLKTIEPWNKRGAAPGSTKNRLTLIRNSLREKGLLKFFPPVTK